MRRLPARTLTDEMLPSTIPTSPWSDIDTDSLNSDKGSMHCNEERTGMRGATQPIQSRSATLHHTIQSFQSRTPRRLESFDSAEEYPPYRAR